MSTVDPWISPGLQTNDLKALYEISRLVTSGESLRPIIDQLIRLARSIFIFDNIAMFTKQTEEILEPIFARAIGRGRWLEADLTWGETVAKEVYITGQFTSRIEALPGNEQDRNLLRYYLGLPVYISGSMGGVLVFTRFGGPPYLEDQIELANRLAFHLAQLIEYRRLNDRLTRLEERCKLGDMQEDFISMISHDLRTPLGLIKGYATTLLRGDAAWDGKTRHEFLMIINEEADRLQEMIDHLMDSSRLQAGTLSMNMQKVCLDHLIREFVKQALIRDAKIALSLEIKETNNWVQADSARIGQVFDNLLSNAVKYAPGSPIIIELGQENMMARVVVRDFGPGIPPEHMENIFRRFYRLPGHDVHIRGVGLGLYICRQIIHAHHGEISVISQPGQGAVFQILLPLDHQA